MRILCDIIGTLLDLLMGWAWEWPKKKRDRNA